MDLLKSVRRVREEATQPRTPEGHRQAQQLEHKMKGRTTDENAA
jgi:hypothetical protein